MDIIKQAKAMFSGVSLEHISDTEKCLADIKRFNCEIGSMTELNCDICHNKGIVAIVNENDNTRWKTKECSCMSMRTGIRRINASGLGDMLKNMTFNTYTDKEPYQSHIKHIAKSYVSNKNQNKWFYIGGQTGAGKTHICTAISGEFLKRGRIVRYMLWRDESVRLKAHVNDDNYGLMIATLKDIDVLYIDDLFKLKNNGDITTGDFNLAFEIINSRNYSNKTTIISCERTIEDLRDIDEALAGRIYSQCGDNHEYAINIRLDPKKNFRFKYA